MTKNNLTPYDTGDRLEPRPWPTEGDNDRYGRVDFDNDESNTEFTLYAYRGEAGRAVLEIDLMAAEERFTVIVDGVEYAPVVAPAATRQCDECFEDATNFYPNLKRPTQFCDSCEHDARRSGWEPGA